jgi:hypothetical protein
MAEREAEAMEKVAVMLEKKAEGRPLPPEDYDFMAKFIDRVEKRVEKKRREEDLEEKRRYEEALATVPELTFEIEILDVDLPDHILYILQEAGMETLGDLVLQMRLDSDRILALNGIGPKSFEQIAELTEGLRVIPEAAPAEAAEGETAEAAVVEEEPVEAEAEAEVVTEVEAEAEEEAAAVESQAAVEAEPAAEAPVEEAAEPEPEPAKAVEEQAKEEEEEADFDKLFSYDARKYGYYEPEKYRPEEEDDDDSKPSKKKKRKKHCPQIDDTDEWEEW